MKNTFRLLTTLVFILFTQILSINAGNEDFFKAEFRDPTSTFVRGSVFTVRYDIRGDLYSTNELKFPEKSDDFGDPIALTKLDIANSFNKNDDGGTNVGDVTYAFAPLKTGTYKIPRAYYITKDGEKKEADELTVTIIEPDEEIPHYNIVMEMPKKLKQHEEFNLTIFVEGEFEVNPAIYMHRAHWWKRLDAITEDVPSKIEKVDNGLKYTYRLRPYTVGTFFVPNALVWIPKDEMHALSNSIGYVEVEKGHPTEVTIKTVAPQTAIVGEPFTLYYKTKGVEIKGELVNISPIFDPTEKPIIFHADMIMYSDEESEGGGVSIESLQTTYILNHVIELRATEEGKYTLPAIKFNIKGVEHLSDTTSITILPRTEEETIPFEIAYKHGEQTYKKGEELKLSLTISAYSPYLNKMQVDMKAIKKELSKYFEIIEEKLENPYKRDATVFRGEAEINTSKGYFWKLKANKDGQITLPTVNIELNEKKYALNSEDTITVKGKADKGDIELKYPKTTALNIPAKIKVLTKTWGLESVKMRDFDKAKMDTIGKANEGGRMSMNGGDYKAYFFEYEVMATKTGMLTIPSILVRTEAGDIETDPISIEVLPADKNSKPTEREPYGQLMTNTSSLDNISPDDAFCISVASANEVYQDQAVYITDYLYTSLNVKRIIQTQATDLADFDPTGNNIFDGASIDSDSILAKEKLVHMDGRNYRVYPVRRTLFFPPTLGKTEMLTMEFDIAFEAGGYRATKWNTGAIKQPSILVKALPEEGKPNSFAGLIANRLEVKAEVLTGDSTILVITIDADGNFPILAEKGLLINNPNEDILTFEELEYDIDLDAVTDYGVKGLLMKKYLIKSTKSGKYTIPAIDIPYFDSDAKKYIISKTKPVSFKID